MTHKEFLVMLCDIENLTAKDLMRITGKSQSYVHSWLNCGKPDFPTMESLVKILFRLGVSLDDFVKLQHPIYDYKLRATSHEHHARIYQRYFEEGSPFLNRRIGLDILDLPNLDEVLQTYIFDRIEFNNLLNSYLDGSAIDLERFNILSDALQPVIISDFTEYIEKLNAQTLPGYKCDIESIEEIAADYAEYGLEYERPEHDIYFPDINYVMLLAAENNASVLKNFLKIADEYEKKRLLSAYMEICAQVATFDKKNKIAKILVENNCGFFPTVKKSEVEMYRELLKKVLQIK